MIKFFEFIQSEVSEASSNTSDTGAGLSVLVIPSDKVAFLSASQGFVNITIAAFLKKRLWLRVSHCQKQPLR
mgnify:CR=1 FL=1